MTPVRFGRRDLQRFGSAVRQAREQKALTQQEAAAVAGVSPRTFGLIESGRTSLSLLAAVRIAETLGVSLDALVASARQESTLAVASRADAAAESQDLTGALEAPRMQARIVAVPPESFRMVQEDAAEGASFGFVLDGQLTVRLDDGEAPQLGCGDSYHAAAGAVRGWANPGAERARLLQIRSASPEDQ